MCKLKPSEKIRKKSAFTLWNDFIRYFNNENSNRLSIAHHDKLWKIKYMQTDSPLVWYSCIDFNLWNIIVFILEDFFFWHQEMWTGHLCRPFLAISPPAVFAAWTGAERKVQRVFPWLGGSKLLFLPLLCRWSALSSSAWAFMLKWKGRSTGPWKGSSSPQPSSSSSWASRSLPFLLLAWWDLSETTGRCWKP